jgi:hypothetical protein
MAQSTFPDGEPRSPGGSVGGTKDGHAVRRADGWESPPSIGWLTGPAAESNPLGTAYTKIGPNSAIWNSRTAAKTLGDQGRGKPKR